MRLSSPLWRCGAFFFLLILAGCGADKPSPSSAIAADNSPCNSPGTAINWQALQHSRCQRLSDYRLFNGQPDQPASTNGGLYYQLNSQLFTDHARKHRYIFLPPEQRIGYQASKVLDFPPGTTLVKVFSLPDISTSEAAQSIIEIRLLIRRDSGWIFIPYRWHNELQDGALSTAGHRQSVSFMHNAARLEFDYQAPSQLRCQTCHQHTDNGRLSFAPIGPKVRHLNRDISVDGQRINQLQHWQNLGLIELPAPPHELAVAPDWRDASQALQQRAKAYLDINCGHCHNDSGAAALSGLRLEYWRDVGYAHGVCNSAHGWRGGGFDIWPGRGDISSLPLRMELSEAKDRMPPLGRSVSDDLAVALIRQWIDSLPAQDCAAIN